MKRDQKKVCTFFIVLFLISIPIQQSVAEKQFLDQDEDTIINENYEYIIITDSSLAHVFQRLISYKSNYISSKLVTLDQIIHNPTYYGRDTQEKIRSFISYAHENWDTTFVLLGGDDSIIPHRGLYAEMIDWKGNTIQSSIPSDMYYGCLNGTWDSDNDFIFGEQEKYSIADEADWYAEVYIGRAPVTNSFEASIFINKVISFETSKKPNSIQLHQSGLNPENNPSSSRIVENLARWIPKDEFTTEKFFAVFQNITVDKWVQSFNEGKLIIQHAGNGNAYQYDLDNINDNEIWTISDISKLRNRFYPIHISLACHSGDFTVDTCIAEEMLLYPYGGASACIFNTDFGATDPENAHRYSGEFLERMFYEIFVNTTNHLGKIVQKSKEYFADKAAVDSMYRWVYYSINLLGDPETPLFEQRDYQSSSIVSVNKEFTESLAGWNVTRFNSIQAAIDAVDEGGTVLVYNGNYDEQITISKSLYLYGTNRNFLDYEPYSGFTTITGNGYENVVTVTSDNVFIDGFIIENGGLDKAGIYLNNVNNSYIYRSSIVSNLGNGIFMDSCNSCYIYESSISFNQKNGIVLNDSHHNHFEGLTVAYNKKNGLILH
ncbi:MAG: C25 family cysteine peptidase, partial [Candidatus Thermoplasmatota archaeon]|nr:C25 family cysteine peptidase [Candidatus Thermoplasmatota archaeon]